MTMGHLAGAAGFTRLVAWPGVAVRLPGYLRAERYGFDPTGSLLAPEGAWLFEPWRGQTYLELFALDLADPGAIVAFVNRVGSLSVFSCFERLSGGLTRYLRDDVRERVLEARASVQQAAAARAWLAARVDREAGEDPEWELCESLEEFRFGARLIRDLTRAWIQLSDPDPLREPAWELPLADWVHAWVEPRVELAGLLLSEGLTHILAALQPRISFEQFASDQAAPGLTTSRALVDHHQSLGLVCALELYNQLLLGASYKQCQFEGCQRLFVFQEDSRHSGRPAASQYTPRRDARYCSPQCRRAQLQRQHRRRRPPQSHPNR